MPVAMACSAAIGDDDAETPVAPGTDAAKAVGWGASNVAALNADPATGVSHNSTSIVGAGSKTRLRS